LRILVCIYEVAFCVFDLILTLKDKARFKQGLNNAILVLILHRKRTKIESWYIYLLL